MSITRNYRVISGFVTIVFLGLCLQVVSAEKQYADASVQTHFDTRSVKYFVPIEKAEASVAVNTFSMSDRALEQHLIDNHLASLHDRIYDLEQELQKQKLPAKKLASRVYTDTELFDGFVEAVAVKSAVQVDWMPSFIDHLVQKEERLYQENKHLKDLVTKSTKIIKKLEEQIAYLEQHIRELRIQKS